MIKRRSERKMKIIAGSILAGLSLLAEVVNEWLHHFFWAAFNIAEGVMIEGAGQFGPGPYYPRGPEAVQIFIGTRIIIWMFIALGVALIIQGLQEAKTGSA